MGLDLSYLMLKQTDIPWLLVGLRVVIAPFLLLDALDGQAKIVFLFLYITGVLSDIFDGIIARRLGVSTVRLRQADGWADIGLYLCVAVSTWLVHPSVILSFQGPLLMAIAFQMSLFAVSLVKFGQFPSFHTYTAKAWGVSLLIAVVSLFGFGNSAALWVAIGLCLINSLEEILMTLILPQWTHDVLSLVHALKLRSHFLKES
jgi:phosphatidylglycerophosphate synthase